MRRRSITFIERKLRAESRNTDCLVGMSIGIFTVHILHRNVAFWPNIPVRS